MTRFHFGSRTITLHATLEKTRYTKDPTAWQSGLHITVRLTEALSAVRVHTNGKSYPGREASKEQGAWILIGDIVLTAQDLASSRSLPTNNPRSATAFTHTSLAELARDTIINIGLASAKFGGAGGGFQAEYVEGPLIRFIPLTGKHWHGSAAQA